MNIKAISLMQPWASLVAIGAKKIETRSWATNYRGPLAIHASKAIPYKNHDLRYRKPFSDFIGAVVAVCKLVDCLLIDDDGLYTVYPLGTKEKPIGQIKQLRYSLPDEPERSFGDYTSGRYAWILDNVQKAPCFYPAKGHLGLWDWEPDLSRRCLECGFYKPHQMWCELNKDVKLNDEECENWKPWYEDILHSRAGRLR